MKWNVPGTVLQINKQDAERIVDVFSSLFLGGGIVLSQVSAITGLEPYTVQNWVKRGLLPPPRQKRYDLEQLCRIITINMLKGVLPMERICGLLTYVNGQLDTENDDIIKDSQLYFMFVQLAARAKEMDNVAERDPILDKAMDEYHSPVPGAKERVRAVLRIMITAYVAARMQQAAEAMLDELEG